VTSLPAYASGRLPTWVAVLGGIVFWMVHLTAEAALVPAACHDRGVTWVMHAVTAVTGAATAAAMGMCLKMVLDSRDTAGSDENATAPSRTLFLGLFGVLTGAIPLALILMEGAYVAFLNPCS